MVNVTLPGMGVIIPLPNVNPSASLAISACTSPGNLSCIYWGEHLTINDSSTCKVRVTNNATTPLTLKMTATLNGNNATMDSSHPIPPRAQGVTWDKENAILNPGACLNATLRLIIAHAMMPPQDIPFVTQVTITGT